jgi:hypothetical protein
MTLGLRKGGPLAIQDFQKVSETGLGKTSRKKFLGRLAFSDFI